MVGVYAGFTNHFNIGAFMEKGLTMRAGQACACAIWSLNPWSSEGCMPGHLHLKSADLLRMAFTCACMSGAPGADGHVAVLQTPVQRYWKNLLRYVEEGKLTPEMVRPSCMLPCNFIIASARSLRNHACLRCSPEAERMLACRSSRTTCRCQRRLRATRCSTTRRLGASRSCCTLRSRNGSLARHCCCHLTCNCRACCCTTDRPVRHADTALRIREGVPRPWHGTQVWELVGDVQRTSKNREAPL